MIYTFKAENASTLSVASQIAEQMGLSFTQQSTYTFDVVAIEDWKLQYFMSQIGAVEVMQVGKR